MGGRAHRLRRARARRRLRARTTLGELRARPFHAARDFEGRTERDLWSATVLLRREGKGVSFSSTTGYVSWDTNDTTDLDYLAHAARRRARTPRTSASSRRSSGWRPQPRRRRAVSDRATLRWQAGLFLFSQDYAQDAVNTFAPYVLSPMLPFSVSQHSPLAALDDAGVGAYGQGHAHAGRAVGRERRGARRLGAQDGPARDART